MSKRHIEKFKQEAVAYVPSNKDKPGKAIAQSLSVGYSALDNWVRKASGTLRQGLSSEKRCQLS